jgi:hypothetical protein
MMCNYYKLGTNCVPVTNAITSNQKYFPKTENQYTPHRVVVKKDMSKDVKKIESDYETLVDEIVKVLLSKKVDNVKNFDDSKACKTC